ncbi:hypothetical protein NL108_001171 [Boleophthalmus pectinirostris]|nr:hypothetical protein NL108_001171 [Boleophthalmus pectinirostris]
MQLLSIAVVLILCFVHTWLDRVCLTLFMLISMFKLLNCIAFGCLKFDWQQCNVEILRCTNNNNNDNNIEGYISELEIVISVILFKIKVHYVTFLFGIHNQLVSMEMSMLCLVSSSLIHQTVSLRRSHLTSQR